MIIFCCLIVIYVFISVHIRIVVGLHVEKEHAFFFYIVVGLHIYIYTCFFYNYFKKMFLLNVIMDYI